MYLFFVYFKINKFTIFKFVREVIIMKEDCFLNKLFMEKFPYVRKVFKMLFKVNKTKCI